MITDIPTAEQFYEAGNDDFNLAWENAWKLLVETIGLDAELQQSASDFGVEPAKFDARIFQRAAGRILSKSLMLLHQGIELHLKGRIASVSPFLLISKNWPNQCDKQDVSFAEFRTLDAQDLIKVHNTVFTPRLDPSFIGDFEKLRIKRNQATHSVVNCSDRDALGVLEQILRMSSVLNKDERWVKIRRAYLMRNPLHLAIGLDYFCDEEVVHREANVIREQFTEKCLHDYFGVDRSKKFYMCPWCFLGSELKDQMKASYTAQLCKDPLGQHAVTCFVCGSNSPVVLGRCSNSRCEGDVLCEDKEVCLTCGVSSGRSA